MKRARPWDGDNVDVVSSGESSSSDVERGKDDMNDNTNQRPSSITSMFQLSVRAPSTEGIIYCVCIYFQALDTTHSLTNREDEGKKSL